MGRVLVREYTTKTPLQMIGESAGFCWGSDISDANKNMKRAIDCIASGHGRTMEFPDIHLILDGYSARVIREFYTHIGCLPTRLQSSTRYVDAKSFKYVTPPSVFKNEKAKQVYDETMEHIREG